LAYPTSHRIGGSTEPPERARGRNQLNPIIQAFSSASAGVKGFSGVGMVVTELGHAVEALSPVIEPVPHGAEQRQES
jgi:hypothetical protein